MLKIRDIKASWRFDWANDPTINVLIEEEKWNPKRFNYDLNRLMVDTPWDQYEDGLWVRDEGLVVTILSHPGDDSFRGGYGNSSYFLNMRDGSIKELRGPWSGNSAWANKQLSEPIAECGMTAELYVHEKGYTYHGGFYVKVGATNKWLEENDADFRLVPTVWHEGAKSVWWNPMLLNNTCVTCNGSEEDKIIAVLAGMNLSNDRCPDCKHKIMIQLPDGMWINKSRHDLDKEAKLATQR